MSKGLESYLEEVSHYLGPGKEKQEILQEIKSHIMEKAEQEFGEVTGDALESIIETYGSPRHVAEKYLEDSPVIAPAFKGHLLRYTMILFGFHLGLILLCIILKTSMAVLPFFYVPKIDSFQAFFYLPMAFVFDFGLVGIILYFVTQSRREIHLPWPRLRLNWQKIGEHRQAKSRIIPLVLMLLGIAVLVWVYGRFGTLFFKTIDFQNPQSLLTPAASRWYSLALLAMIGLGTGAYTVKFFTSSEWVNLLRSGCQLVILGIIINRPIENPFIEFFYIDLQIAIDIIIAALAILIAIDFLKSLVIITIKGLKKKPQTQ